MVVATAEVEAFRRDGFVNGGRVLDDAEIEVLKQELDKVIAGETERSPVHIKNLSRDKEQPVWQVVNIWEASEPYRKLAYHPDIVRLAAALIGADDVKVWHDQIQYKPPRHGGENHWHQDGPLWTILGADTMVTAWIPLDDVDESNGCMSMVPGSHQWGPQMKEYLSGVPAFDRIGEGYTAPNGEPVQARLWPVGRGEVSFHHCLTWHGSHQNRSDRPRRAIAIHYMDAATPYVAAGSHVMQPFVDSADGEPVRGRPFLEVVRGGEPVAS